MAKKPHRYIILFYLLTIVSGISLYAQTGGSHTYSFLNLSSSARSGALGGMVPAIANADVGMADNNPAYVGTSMHNQISLNYINYFADIQYGKVAYGFSGGKYGDFSLGLFYLNYGDFIEANEYGEITGSFKASEYNLGLSWGYQIDSTLRVGLTLKPIYSAFERYTSWGMAFDAGLLYISPGKLTSAGLIVRNLGMQLSSYDSPGREPLPFEIAGGFSQKIEHAPFRLTFAFRNLQKFNLDVLMPNDDTDPISGDKLYANKFSEIALKSIDHLVAGVEFIPGKVISVRFAYNFRLRDELKLGTRNTATGLSFGLGLNLGKFNIDYALANYHVSGISHLLSLTTDLDHFLKL